MAEQKKGPASESGVEDLIETKINWKLEAYLRYNKLHAALPYPHHIVCPKTAALPHDYGAQYLSMRSIQQMLWRSAENVLLTFCYIFHSGHTVRAPF